MDPQEAQRMAQFLTTEHFTLTSAQSSNVSEAGSRVSSFLGILSGVLIALGFVAQISGIGQVFFVFAVIIFPIVIVVGVFTFVRLMQLEIANEIYTVAINRIRHFYVEYAPQVSKYLSFPAHDDPRSIDRARVNYIGFRAQLLVVGPTQIALLNSFLIGIFLAILATLLLNLVLVAAVPVGIIGFVVAFFLHLRIATVIDGRARKYNETRFPAPENQT